MLRVIGYSQELVQFVGLEGDPNCELHFSNNATLSNERPYWIESSGRIRLISIKSNRDENTRVEFHSISNSSTSINRQILDNIKIFNYKNELIKKVGLEYIYPENINGNSYKRFFLSEINFSYGSYSQEKYMFEYNNIVYLQTKLDFC